MAGGRLVAILLAVSAGAAGATGYGAWQDHDTTSVTVDCGPNVSLPRSSRPAVILGDRGDGDPRWSIALDAEGRWALVSILDGDTVCLVDKGDRLIFSPEVVRKPGEDA